MTTGPRNERGFVLIGVVMFVLALTILGLSLFSLSSYEGQFVNRTLDESRAFYLAQGGIERAKAVLGAPPGLLSNAKLSLPYEGVTYAVAMQRINATTQDSTGPVNWSGDTITIEVLAQVRNEERRLRAQFMPKPEKNPYKRLFTSANEMVVNSTNINPPPAGPDVCGTTRLTGAVWQASPDTAWAIPPGCATWFGPRPVNREPLPLAPLAITNYITAQLPIAGPPPYGPNGPGDRLDLLAGNGNVAFFYGPAPYSFPPPANSAHFSFFQPSTRNLEIRVSGTAVWLLPKGMRTESMVSIRKIGSDARLVIVAGPSITFLDDPLAGVWLFGGVQADANMPVFIASSGRVWIEHQNNYGVEGHALALSVFGNGIHVTGPIVSSGVTLNLSYDPSMSSIVDELISGGLLPPPTGSAIGGLAMVPGTWRDLTQ